MSDKKHHRLKRNEHSKRRIWTDDDKCILLKALKKYGHTDISNISKMLPNKSSTAIKVVINKLMTKAQYSRQDMKPFISDWLEDDMLKNTESLVPQALFLIHKFEKHPLPKEAVGCNFRDAYNFLYRMMLGYPPINVSLRTRETVYFLLSKVIKEVRPAYHKEVLEQLGTLYSKYKNNKVYPGKSKPKDIDVKDIDPSTT